MQCFVCGHFDLTKETFVKINGTFNIDKKKNQIEYTKKIYLYACPECCTIICKPEDIQSEG